MVAAEVRVLFGLPDEAAGIGLGLGLGLGPGPAPWCPVAGDAAGTAPGMLGALARKPFSIAGRLPGTGRPFLLEVRICSLIDYNQLHRGTASDLLQRMRWKATANSLLLSRPSLSASASWKMCCRTDGSSEDLRNTPIASSPLRYLFIATSFVKQSIEPHEETAALTYPSLSAS